MARGVQEAVTAQQLLDYNEQAFVDFMEESHTGDRQFDISRITDFAKISSDVRDELSEKLQDAAKKLNPLNTDTLEARLNALSQMQAFGDTTDDHSSTLQCLRDPSRTPSPAPIPEPADIQARAYGRLVTIGGTPVIHKSELKPYGAMTKDNKKRAGLFTEVKKDSTKDYIIPLYTAQLDHWRAFKQRWQWCNRGPAASEKGFAEFKAFKAQQAQERGMHKLLFDQQAFEKNCRRLWSFGVEGLDADDGLEISDGQGFEDYVHLVEKRLALHRLILSRPLRLSEDPHAQDGWMTWVEYLNFLFFQEDLDKKRMEWAEPQYSGAMQLLLSFAEERPKPYFETRGPLSEHLKSATELWTKERERVIQLSRASKDFVKAQFRVWRHQKRIQWALQELVSIEMRGAPGEPGEYIGLSFCAEKYVPPPTKRSRIRTTSSTTVKNASVSAEPRRSKRLRNDSRTDTENKVDQTPPALTKASRGQQPQAKKRKR